MRPHTFRRAFAASCALAIGFTALTFACSGPATPVDSASQDQTADDGLDVQFATAYSAFDGVHDYKVPAKVTGVKKPKWSASPPELVDLEVQPDGSVMITTRGVGVVTVTAKSGSLTGSTKLTIAKAEPTEWQAGSDRYNNGIVFQRPDGGRPEGGGGGGGGDRPPPNPSLACTNCHARGKSDVEHTPMQTGGFTDDELVTIFTKGKKPADVPQRIMSADRWQQIHQWKMEPEEQRGLVWYLRSLEPKSQGVIDFGGGRGKGDKGGGAPAP